MLIYTAAQKRAANTFSDKMAVYVLLALGDVVDCFLVLSLELELQFLNHITVFAKLFNSLAFCYINDHDLFMIFVFQYVLSRKKKNVTNSCCFIEITEGTYMNTHTNC